MNISELVLLDDIVHLPKETLKEICTSLNTPDDGSTSELVSRIWPLIKGNNVKREQVYSECKERIFGGKTSVSWYKFDEGIKDVRQLIINSHKEFNPFEEMKIPPRDQISNEPTLIGAASGSKNGEYYLRYMYKVGVTREIIMDSIELRPRTTTTTLYVNENEGYLEVRTDPRNSNKIAKSFAQLIQLQIAMEAVQVTAPFGHSVEKFADALGGELIDTVGKPNLAIEEFTEGQAEAVVGILSALDAYFDNEDISELQTNLQESRRSLGDDFTAIPFTALILNGMEKVGMGVKERDLRGTPLYDYLSSSIEHQGCFIQFPVNEDGIFITHTIRVGLQSNSVFFMSQASEAAIDIVRKCVII
ncbi:hypothetical protein [Paenibacillus aquistagni]|uniref:hypothetical protein n=1 Tax=Paenibacillus aquistagni TaxID=1852522 RepID=UPI00145B62D9|nr:hypothetical protein [Paenibacillus aquistagni]NMM52049.1 hypothetical protein [Paenibacillus aquistagni]